MIAQIGFYITDYILYALIHWSSRNSDDAVVQSPKYKVTHQLLPESCNGVTWYSLGLCVNAANVALCIETISTAIARFEIHGVLSLFVPDSVTSHSLLELGDAVPSGSLVNSNYAYFLLILYYLSIVIIPITVNALLFVIWTLPLFVEANHWIYGGLMEVIWFLQAWNGLDALWLASWGLLFTKMTTESMINSILPDQCGKGNIVEELTGEECGYITSTFTYGMGLLTLTVVLNHCSILYSEYTFVPKTTLKCGRVSVVHFVQRMN